MLASGLRAAAVERNLSLREIGRRLDYRQPVVLSHMASGRVPIPVDRVLDIAREVGLPEKQFLLAVLQQRHPEIDWEQIAGTADPFAAELETTAGRALSELSPAHRRVLRDVVRDRHPEERWLSIPEIAAVKFLRELFPNMQTSGLSEDDRDALRLTTHLRNADNAPQSPQSKTRSKKNES
jgi:hypothetical protein